jgi:hypothetical protein
MIWRCRPSAVSGSSGAWLQPPEYRNNEACDQGDYPEADCYPVPDRRGISINNHLRPVYEQPIYQISIEVRDFSLDKAIPQCAAVIDAQIDRDDASDDFIKEKLHSNIRSSSPHSMTRSHDSSIGRVTAVIAFALPGLSVAGSGVGAIAGTIAVGVLGSPSPAFRDKVGPERTFNGLTMRLIATNKRI